MSGILVKNFRELIEYSTLLIFVFIILVSRLLIWYFIPQDISFVIGITLYCIGTYIDILPIILFILIFFYTKSKIPYLCAILISTIEIFINFINILFIVQTKEKFSYTLYKQIYLNMYPYIYDIILISCISILFMFLLFICCKKVYATKCYINFFLFIFVISCVSTSVYEFCKDKYLHHGYSVPEWISCPTYQSCIDFFNERKCVLESYNGVLKYPKKQRVSTSCTTQYNKIVIIAIESLDLAYLHSINANIPHEATPNIDLIANKYILFDNFFTASQPTNNGLHALLASRLDYFADPMVRTPNLFSELSNSGYETWFISMTNGYYGNGKQNFEIRYSPNHSLWAEYFSREFNNLKYKGWGYNSNIAFDKIINLLKTNQDKIFIFASTIDTHPPYGNSPDRSDICWNNKNIVNSHFLLSLSQLDRELGYFIKQVERNNLLQNDTLILITSDHSATHGENFTKRNQFTPDRIPLIWISNNSDMKIYSHNYISQIDLPVTILNTLGINIPNSMMGSDIKYSKSSISKYKNTLIIRSKNREYVISIDKKDESDFVNWYKQYYN